MPGGPIGTIFVELDLDASQYTAKQKRILHEARTTTLGIENNWRILGDKSNLMYDAMRQRITNAYERIKNNAKSSADEILRAERAKNREIQKINDEQFGRLENHIQKVKIGWVDMVKGAIVFRTAMASLHAVYSVLVDVPRRGIKAIDDLKTAQASLAAAFATNDVSLTFDKAYKIAGGMVEKIQELDRAFIGTADELTMLADAMATFGAGIDLSNQESQRQFVTFGNIVKLMTRGQDFQRQAYQEVRSLMEGANVQGALLVKKLEAMGVNTKAMIPLWREQGTIVQNVVKYMSGYHEAMSEIEQQLQTQRASLETITTKIIRQGMQPAYEDIRDTMRDINDELITTNGLTEKAYGIVQAIQYAWIGIKNAFWVVHEVIKQILEPLRIMKNLVQDIGKSFSNIGTDLAGFGDMLLDLTGDPEDFRNRGRENAQAYLEGMGTYVQGLEMFYTDTTGDLPLKTKGGAGKKGPSEETIKGFKKQEEAWMKYLQYTEDEEIETAQFINGLREKQTAETISGYEKQLEAYGKYLEYMEQEEIDTQKFITDIREKAAKDQLEEERNRMKLLQEFVVNGFNQIADTFAEFVTTGKFQFKNFVDSIIADLSRMFIKLQILNALGVPSIQSLFLSSKGSAFEGGVRKFGYGDVVSSPTVFSTKSGYGLMGETGPEAIMPLARTSTGHLGVRSEGSGKMNFVLNVINQTGQPVRAEQKAPKFDGEKWVIGVVLKGIDNNTMGLRYALGGT